MKKIRTRDIQALMRSGQYLEAADLLLNASASEEKVVCPTDVRERLSKYCAKRQEHFIVLCLDGSHHVIHEEVVTKGLVNRTVIHPREAYRPGILHSATAILVAHNHPSGQLTPSSEDLAITRRLVEAGHLLGIPLLDHIIIGRSPASFYSFIENGVMPVSLSEKDF